MVGLLLGERALLGGLENRFMEIVSSRIVYAAYSEVSSKQAGWNKQAGLNFWSYLINEQDRINKQDEIFIISNKWAG